MSRFIRAITVAAAPILIAVVDTIAPPAIASPNCMTLDEARKAFPGDHLYWHGPKHCWDNVGKAGKAKPAADAKSEDAAPASTANDKAADVDKPSQSAKPAATNGARGARAAAVPFIADDPTGVVSWSTTTPAAAPAAPAPQAAQQDDPPPQPALAALAEDANVVIGAPNAAPGSPDYLLEHCCWPPTVAEQQANPALLPRMVIASAGACGLAAGLWYFVYRRRRRPAPARRAPAAPSIVPRHGNAPWPAARAPSPYQVSPAALHPPRRIRSPAGELQDVS